MKQPKEGEYRSKVYTDRPEYADLDSPEKFQAILGIIGTRLRQHPNAICSYSGGSDSDILIDMIESLHKYDAETVDEVYQKGYMKGIEDGVKGAMIE